MTAAPAPADPPVSAHVLDFDGVEACRRGRVTTELGRRLVGDRLQSHCERMRVGAARLHPIGGSSEKPAKVRAWRRL